MNFNLRRILHPDNDVLPSDEQIDLMRDHAYRLDVDSLLAGSEALEHKVQSSATNEVRGFMTETKNQNAFLLIVYHGKHRIFKGACFSNGAYVSVANSEYEYLLKTIKCLENVGALRKIIGIGDYQVIDVEGNEVLLVKPGLNYYLNGSEVFAKQEERIKSREIRAYDRRLGEVVIARGGDIQFTSNNNKWESLVAFAMYRLGEWRNSG